MSGNQPQSTSSSNPLSNIGSSISNAFSGLGSGLSNIFTGGSDSSLAGDSSGMGGYDVAGLFGNLGSNAFDEATGSAQATQAITPPAQAQTAAAQGQDPSAGIGGAQSQTGTQTASTGPAAKQPPSQEQQDQDARNKGVDELRRLLNQRNKNKPWQYPPREIAAFQAQPGIGRGPAGIEAGLYSPNISPDAAVRAGLLAPEMIDPATGTIRRDVPPSEAPAPDESGPTGKGQLVPRPGTTQPAVVPGEAGRQITVRPRGAVLPPRTVPGTAGAAPGTDAPAPASPLTFKEGEPIPTGGGGIPGLPGLGGLPWWLEGGAIGLGAVPLSATPAETGEFTPAEPNFVRPDAPPTGGLPAPKDPPDPPLPPPRPRDQPARRQAPPAAPRQVWVPATPGHYVPTTGIGRGGGTWVPGTPGHYMDAPPQGPQGRTTGVNDIGGAPRDPVPGWRRTMEQRGGAIDAPAAPQGGPPAADSASAGLPTRKGPEAGPEPSVGLGGPTGQSQLMREVLGGLLPAILPELGMMALAMGGRGRGGRIPLGGLGGMRGFGRFPHRWGGGPLRPGYYPHPNGGMAYHPGGYHPGWGGEGRPVGPLAQPRPGGGMSNPGGFARVQQNMTRLESGGRYDALGPMVPGRGRAIGKYQVMPENVGRWTQEALGRPMSPEEFRANPQAQEAVFRDQMFKNFRRYGNWRDAASVWFTGRPFATGRWASDRYMSGGAYAGQAVAGLDGGGGTPQGGGGAQPGTAYAGPDQGDGGGLPDMDQILSGLTDEDIMGAQPGTAYTGPDQPNVNANVG